VTTRSSSSARTPRRRAQPPSRLTQGSPETGTISWEPPTALDTTSSPELTAALDRRRHEVLGWTNQILASLTQLCTSGGDPATAVTALDQDPQGDGLLASQPGGEHGYFITCATALQSLEQLRELAGQLSRAASQICPSLCPACGPGQYLSATPHSYTCGRCGLSQMRRPRT
jgi:ribosomal protein S27AE